jgi:tetratricopeptide (TPR) repeat protein
MRVNAGFAVAVVVLAAWAAGARAAPAAASAPDAALSAALAQLQAGDAAGAAKALRVITSREPHSAQAWRALGTAEQQLHNYDQAIAAYQHALQIEPDSPRLFYSLGTAYAAKHDSQQAFEWLGRAAATRRYDMTQMSADPALAELRSDPRFAPLLPTPAQFENPFVESVKIIREWRGEASGDQFGWIARNIGDVDGDGVTDIVTSAPTHGAQASNAGRIYVYSVGSGRLR